MPNEIKVTAELHFAKGEAVYDYAKRLTNIGGTGGRFTAGTFDVGTAATAVTFSGGQTNAGWAVFVNTDDTNFVELGVFVSSTFYSMAKLLPGEPALMRLGTNSPYAKADTAPIKLLRGILEP